MTAGERLRALAGTTGTAATLLLLIGSGATAGAALENYSKLPTGTAAQHLLAEVSVGIISPASGAFRYSYHGKVRPVRPAFTSGYYVQEQTPERLPDAQLAVHVDFLPITSYLYEGAQKSARRVRIEAQKHRIELQSIQDRMVAKEKAAILQQEEELAIALLMLST